MDTKLAFKTAKLLAHMEELHHDYRQVYKETMESGRTPSNHEIKLLEMANNMLSEMNNMADLVLDIFKALGLSND